MRAAVNSVFEVAFWFADKALDENEYLQPQKLQYLLFLSQAYYAVAHDGKRLIPAIFVAEELGPIEPSVHVAFAQGRPAFEVNMFLPDDVQHVLDSIWARFGHHSSEFLAKLCKQSKAYQFARKRGVRSEIPLKAIQRAFTRASDSPALDQVVRPKWARSATGKPVTVKSWNPAQLKR